MSALPCPLCGYDASIVPSSRGETASGEACPHCQLDPLDASLGAPRAGTFGGVRVGLAALPRGLYYLATTRRVKRWLLPPLILTLGAFVAIFWWFWALVSPVVEAVRDKTQVDLPWPEGWYRTAVEWVLRSWLIGWLAQFGGLVLFGLVSFLAALWAFSIVYEALAGPFLDEVHGRLEERWFGANPRDRIQRPTALPPEKCALLSVVASVPAAASIVTWWMVTGPLAWWYLLGVPLPFLVASFLHPEYGRWLWWIVRLEGGTLWVSVKAALLAGVVLVLFLPVKFLPVVGYLVFACVAGFTTALSLLDIPFSRRQWSLRARFSFMVHNLPAVTTFGVVASLLFLIPFIGPILMVPAASAGGLWLVCRVDKDFLRPEQRRIDRGS
jgi:uncharacterized protein involved in cysteine biosynthesis